MQTLKGFGIEELEAAQIAAGACLHYLAETQNNQLSHIRTVQRIHAEEYLWMDRFTIRNLELLTPAFPTGKALIDIVDTTDGIATNAEVAPPAIARPGGDPHAS